MHEREGFAFISCCLKPVFKMKKTLIFFAVLISFFACKTKQSNFERDITKAEPVMCAPKGVSVEALADTDQPAPVFEGLGDVNLPVTTNSEEARKYFKQGMLLANAFNHAEAARSLKYATRLDPDCAMCHWGLAFVLGPNYNMGMEPAVAAIAYESAQKALKLMPETSPKEQALIKAMAKRYPTPEAVEDRRPFDEAFADALREVHRRFPDDDDIAALFAESLMDIHPWDLWTFAGEPQPWTPEILQTIEGILARNPDHIAAIHLYIHATEASPSVPGTHSNGYSPEKAKAYAAKLPSLAPGAGHLVHMPSHTYIRTGDYHDGTIVNSMAVEVDSIYVSACHAAGAYPLAYYPHNFHFLAACAAFEGNGKIAIEASYRMARKLDTIVMRAPGMETIQHYWSIPTYVLVKFSKWDEILNTPEPAFDLVYPRTIWHYARGLAFVNKKDIAKASAELEKLKTIQKNNKEQLSEITIWYINSVMTLVDIAGKVLEGEIAASRKQYDKAVALLEEAIALEDGLNYNEPPDWFFSVRHHLGPVLMDAGRHAEAEKLYRRDLELFPRTGWAYHGLYTALKKQGKQKEAEAVYEKFQEAWAYADVELEASKVVN
jgi:tetratricopeptide (TPR) repeat protein